MTEIIQTTASNKVLCDVVNIEPLTATIFKVQLKLQEPALYQAGQYLQIYLSDTDKRPFSIASIPGDDLLELHIGGAVSDSYASQALIHLREQNPVLVQVGLGEAWLRPVQRPIILLAGGSGFSYVYSIAKALAQSGHQQPVLLYWGLRQADAGYYRPQLDSWQSANPLFQWIEVRQEASADWTGRQGLVHQAVLADIADLAGYDIYMAGPFAMVAAARDAFLAQGAISQQMYADAFAWI